MKKNIALIVSFIDNEYSMNIIDGAWLAAEALDVNLYIMPTRLLISKYHRTKKSSYQYQYNTMFSYITEGNFDAVVIETGVICNGMKDEEISKLFASFGDIPVISICHKVEGYPNICFNCSGLADELQHLIDVHGCRRIGFIGGPGNNTDAAERFGIYKKVLEDNNIAYDEKLYAEGDFSEYCVDLVTRVLEDNKGNIDALCFANDRMAIGGYEALEKQGLIPGKDIFVTGFDDAPSASAMNPMLTTVRSNVSALGYKALEGCVDIINGKEKKDITIDTSLILRNSCGCPLRINVINDKLKEISIKNISISELCANIYELLAGSLDGNSALTITLASLSQRFSRLLQNINKDPKICAMMMDDIFEIFENIDHEVIPYNEFSYALNLVRKKALTLAEDPDKADEMFYELLDRITGNSYSMTYETSRQFRELMHVTNAIVYDVLANIKDEAASYMSIVENVMSYNAKSCYLFVHEFPIVCHSFTSWLRPRNERLICYHDHLGPHALHAEDQKLASDSILRGDYISDERHTFFLNPLFYDEEHYGLLMSEVTDRDYRFLSWVMLKQICYALKTKHLMEEHMAAQERMLKNIKEIESYNKDLHMKSISDELTGILNRRGFMERVDILLSNPDNYGRKAAIIFADMNHLKKINDNYGHDDGDFAICGMANILANGFRNNDVVARFGGDEFAAFCFINNDGFEKACRNRILNLTNKFNDESNKPYLVTMSIGVFEFTCTKDTNLTECMNTADALLYEDKKQKPAAIIR